MGLNYSSIIRPNPCALQPNPLCLGSLISKPDPLISRPDLGHTFFNSAHSIYDLSNLISQTQAVLFAQHV